jgi:hypothetical protein
VSEPVAQGDRPDGLGRGHLPPWVRGGPGRLGRKLPPVPWRVRAEWQPSLISILCALLVRGGGTVCRRRPLVHLAPAAEPPIGFVARVVERLGLRGPPRGDGGPSPSRSPSGLWPAAMIVLLAFGLEALVGHRAGPPSRVVGHYREGFACERSKSRGAGAGLYRERHVAVHVVPLRLQRGARSTAKSWWTSARRSCWALLAVGR